MNCFVHYNYPFETRLVIKFIVNLMLQLQSKQRVLLNDIFLETIIKVNNLMQEFKQIAIYLSSINKTSEFL